MSKKKATLLQKLTLFAFSCLLILGLLGLAEVYFRWFTNINFLDVSKGTFTPQRFGKSYGNTPNFEGVSYGEKFHINSEGFRYDPDFKPTAKEDAPAIMLLGDSVLFGPAVLEDETISGHLQKNFPQIKFYNAAVIGYDTFDYRNVATSLIPEKSDIKVIYVVYCLNDLISTSSQEIKEKIGKTPDEQPQESKSPVRAANDYLRSRSKFYLFLKDALRDTQMIYFKNDLIQYQDEETVKKGLQPLIDMKNHLEKNNVELKIYISPYEAQLRKEVGEDFLLPQRKLVEFFKQNDIDFYDMTQDFKAASGNYSKQLFLYGDPMHTNAKGNELISQIIEKDIKEHFSQTQN